MGQIKVKLRLIQTTSTRMIVIKKKAEGKVEEIKAIKKKERMMREVCVCGEGGQY